MDEISVMVGLALAGLAMFLLAFGWARRSRARAEAKAGAKAGRQAGVTGAGSEPMTRRLELRLDEIETRFEAQIQALTAAGSPEDRLQAMAGSLVGLIRDKNATLETALAGLDQLRARLRALEQMGDLAEARGLFERLEARIDEQRTAQAAAAAAVEERLAALKSRTEAEAGPRAAGEAASHAASQAALAEQFSRLYAQKDAGVAAMLTRLEPLETRLADLEGARATETEPREAIARLKVQLEALRAAQDASQREVAELRAEVGAGAGPVAEIAERLGGLHAQKEALAETLLARLGALEAGFAARDPQAALDAFAARLEAAQATREAVEAGLRDRVAALETPDAHPFAEISEQLTRLYAQKDATVETVFARLAPLEARLGDIEAGLAALDPQAALDAFAARLEAAQATREAVEAGLRDRVAALETPDAHPFAEISEQLTRLYAQKDATVETVFARLAPLEARLGDIEAGLAALDPQAALDAFAARLEAAQATREAVEAGLRDRVAALETPDAHPFAEISEQLTRLYAQKDATVETVFARLAPLEARLGDIEAGLAALDPQAALDAFAARLEAAQATREAVEAGLRDRVAALETPDAHPFAEISEQLTRLYAQKDATVETVFARLAPLEARLGDIEAGLAARDPQSALDRFAERLEAAQATREAVEAGLRDRVAALESSGANPFAEISEQLTRLYAQKDATVETVFARLAPLEARLGEIEAGLATRDPQGALDRFAERLEAVQGRLSLLEMPGENPFAEISEQLTRLYAQKDATIETVFARLAPLEERLAGIEQGVAQSMPRLAALEEALEADDPRGALAALAAALGGRMEALRSEQGAAAARIDALRETLCDAVAAQPFAEIADQLTRLYAQKDAGVAAVTARLAPLEARLAALETRSEAGPDSDEEAARAEAQAIATQLIAARAAAEQTELFANRLALLEASLPRLTAAQVEMTRLPERHPAAGSLAGPIPETASETASETAASGATVTKAAAEGLPDRDIDAETPGETFGDPMALDLMAIRDMPRIVSLHHK